MDALWDVVLGVVAVTLAAVATVRLARRLAESSTGE
jgi:hypothetical protein